MPYVIKIIYKKMRIILNYENFIFFRCSERRSILFRQDLVMRAGCGHVFDVVFLFFYESYIGLYDSICIFVSQSGVPKIFRTQNAYRNLHFYLDVCRNFRYRKFRRLGRPHFWQEKPPMYLGQNENDLYFCWISLIVIPLVVMVI